MVRAGGTDRDRINADIDWEGVFKERPVGEKMTEDGRYFSGDAGQVWTIITPKGGILSALSCCGTGPLLRSELSRSNPSPAAQPEAQPASG